MEEEVDGYGVIKQVLSLNSALPEGMAALLRYCKQRYPHPVWEETARLDYAADAWAMQTWFLEQLPIADSVKVVWFALWDVPTGLNLRGSSSWSRDPEDWEWWYDDDFEAGSYESPVLAEMLELARQVEDPEEAPDVPGGVWELTEMVLTLGYVSLAAVQVMRNVEAVEVVGSRQELWAVSGFPDALYGIILGRLTSAGFEPFEH